ncbi:regulator of G-protein signaling 5b [Alosa sapidissima]|uniref:regulator of G-protein signaling 5b n=1 Tax=Alosa sapidissima TaxID=34773 RepID=UPI001C09F220|nr:regulator of G-protein signaling 5b [Alosa sapidissima]
MCRGLESLPSACLERAKELKSRLGSLLHKKHMGLIGQKADMQRQIVVASLRWKESFQELLQDKQILHAFQAFLMSEYSEENLAFYLACEDYTTTQSPSKLPAKAKKIYDEFIICDAPREVNLDHETKIITVKNLENPNTSCFDLARSKIYSLMEKDCYPRFLKSVACQELSRQLAG